MSSPVVTQEMESSSAANFCWIKRIYQDLEAFERGDRPWGIQVEAMENDICLWEVTMKAPFGSMYEGGEYKGILQFSDQFPFHPPVFTFTTPIFHPNIGYNGSVCLDKVFHHWNPCHSVWSFLVSIQFIFEDINDGAEPLNRDAYAAFVVSPTGFQAIVKDSIEQQRKLRNELSDDMKVSEVGEDLKEMKINSYFSKSDK